MTENNVESKTNATPDQENFSDRRRHFRADIPQKGRFLTDPGEDFPCVVVNLSAGGALLRAKNPPEVGQSVVIYIDDVGRFEGKVIRSGNHSFAVDYRSRRAKSKRTADALIQVMNKTDDNKDRRKAPRIKTDSDATVIFEDGETVPCAIRDISLTGASIELDPAPQLGAQLQLGKMMAKVVRRFDGGVGVVFTGSASHLEEVFEGTIEQENATDAGTGLAKTFGKKN